MRCIGATARASRRAPQSSPARTWRFQKTDANASAKLFGVGRRDRVDRLDRRDVNDRLVVLDELDEPGRTLPAGARFATAQPAARTAGTGERERGEHDLGAGPRGSLPSSAGFVSSASAASPTCATGSPNSATSRRSSAAVDCLA